jgi:beta-lactamase regulating signal transducer with metallopeptidase domain
MPHFIIYLVKVSAVLAVMYLFYQFVLRRLTFYNWNRWYLLLYSLLAFVIPFININPFLEKHELQHHEMIRVVPSFSTVLAVKEKGFEFTTETILWLLFIIGVAAMFARTTIQFISLYRLRKKASLLNNEGVKLFHVNENINPFSFHNAIYFNANLHSEEDMEKIIQHEFVHIKQKHSLDILLGELLCIVLWFNPFAWLMRHAIRQNLEFVADEQVLGNGLDKKQYQYLLVKVIGNHHYSIVANFNFSSLKNRIMMMNKLKSAKLHLVKFLFVVPLLAVLLISFRDKISFTINESKNQAVDIAGLVVDAQDFSPIAGAIVMVKEKNISTITDARGYYKIQLPVVNGPLQFKIEVLANDYRGFLSNENWGNFSEKHIYDSYGKTIEFFGLSKKGYADGSFAAIAGNAVFEEGLDYSNVLIVLDEIKKQKENPNYWIQDSIPDHQLPVNVRQVEVKKENGENKVIIKLKNGNVEIYDLNNSKQKDLFEKKYGYSILPPPPPAPPAQPKLPANVKSMSVTKQNGESKIEIELKNGIKENYDLRDPKQKAAFEKKYGKIEEPAPAEVPVGIIAPVSPVSAEVPVGIVAPASPISPAEVSAAIAPVSPSITGVATISPPSQPSVLNSKGYYLSIADDNGECIVIVKDKNKKIVEAVKFTEWNENEQQYEKKYGKLLPPPPPPPPSVPATFTVNGVIKSTLKNNNVDASIGKRYDPLSPQANAGSTIKLSITEDEVQPGGTYKIYGRVEPLYVVDGKIMSAGVLKSMDPNTIDQINVLKGSKATEKYGTNGVNGVVEIKTKNSPAIVTAEPKLNISTKGIAGNWPSGALYFIDGKETTAAEVEKLNTDLIYSTSTISKDAAVKMYGEKARYGVIFITTKAKAATNK